MKKCPFCAEEIQNETIVCPYCERELVTINSAHRQPVVIEEIKTVLPQKQHVAIEISKAQLAQIFVLMLLVIVVFMVWIIALNLNK